LQLDVGDLRFLKVTLPTAEDRLWTVFVNGKVAEPAQDGDAYRIPLEDSVSDEISTVDFIYEGRGNSGAFGKQKFYGPRFNLPLNNVTWAFFVRSDRHYHNFDGTMRLLSKAADVEEFTAQNYASSNLRQMKINKDKAKLGLAKGEAYARRGDPRKAKKAFEEAMTFAQGQDDREDARIQYENIVKQQAIVGLVQRRNEMRLHQNIRDDRQLAQMRGFNKGNFTADYADAIQQSLSSEDNQSLAVLTEKIIEQQAAAAGVAQAIKLTMPEHGRQLEFFRLIQIDPQTPVSVEFMGSNTSPVGNMLRMLWPMLALVIIFRMSCGRLVRPAAIA
jgi:tetratricopeptide (TPR) repeat protein